MTGTWRDRRGVVVALVAVALAVWAAVAWRVTSALSGPADDLDPIVVADASGGGGVAPGLPAPYLGSVQDPFEPPPGLVRSGTSQPTSPAASDPFEDAMSFDDALAYSEPYVEPEPPPPAVPPVYVVGVVGEKAILELDGGGSAVVGAGERAGEVEVLTVSPSLVTLRYRGVEYESPPGG
ncbi:MAG: hypothetical protein AAGK21_00190 [Bacteroidota bacterium]